MGLRIVPKKSRDFPHLIRKFEKEFGRSIKFKLNYFSKTTKEKTRIRKSSGYYYAINYYFAINPFFMEVQIRTPSIDLWSDLTHDNLYKQKIKISSATKRYLVSFGRICNIVDFFEIITRASSRPLLPAARVAG